MDQKNLQNTMKLKVDTGKIVVPIEDADGESLGEMAFIPTDSDILKRYKSVVEFFNNVSFSEDLAEEEVVKFSDEIRKQLDYLFGYNVSDSVFQKCGPLTVITGGNFYFESVLNGIVGIIEQITNERVEKKLAKIRKATAKYHN